MLKYLFILIFIPSIANAYIGPGMAGGVMMVILAIIFALFIGLIGIVWFPIKTLLIKIKNKNNQKKKNV